MSQYIEQSSEVEEWCLTVTLTGALVVLIIGGICGEYASEDQDIDPAQTLECVEDEGMLICELITNEHAGKQYRVVK